MRALLFLAIIVAVAGIVLLCVIAFELDETWLRWWAIAATILLVPMFLLGALAGGLEAKGKVSGIDVSLSALSHVYKEATREASRIERQRPPPTVQVYNAAHDSLPPISRARLTDGSGSEEVIDL